MGILSRFKDIMEANVNALLDKCEDPSKMIDQTLRKLREDYADVKKETAAVMADEKEAERRLKEAQDKVAQYSTAAANAVKSGNDDDARKLIESKQKIEATMPALQMVYDTAKSNADKMRDMTVKLQNDIETLEARKDSIKAKVSVAKAQQKVNKMVSGSKSSEASLEAFERMERKADKMLDQADAEAELNAASNTVENLASKYATPASSVEDELAALKAELGK